MITTTYKLTNIVQTLLRLTLVLMGATSSLLLHAQNSTLSEKQPIVEFPKKTLFVFHEDSDERSNRFFEFLIPSLNRQPSFNKIEIINTLKTHQANITQLLSSADSNSGSSTGSSSSHCAITIGLSSLEKVLAVRDNTIIFSTLVSKNKLNHLIDNYTLLGSQVTGIYQEQSFVRQIYLAQAINQNIESIIILLGRNTRYLLPDFRKQARQHSLKLLFKILNHQASSLPFFSKIEAENIFLFVMNDPEHYSEQDLKSLMIASYQQQIPLIGSKKTDSLFAAVASIYTPLKELADETALDISKVCSSEQLIKAKYSHHYNITVNQQIADNLQLSNINEKKLLKSIQTSESIIINGQIKNE